MRELDVSAYRWCVSAGVPPNTISKLLSPDNRGVTLATANRLSQKASELAKETGSVLPAFDQAAGATNANNATGEEVGG